MFFVLPDDVRTAPAATAGIAPNMLRAQQVLDLIITRFALDVPPIVKDPLEFLRKELESALPEGDLLGGPPYFLDSVIDRIKRAARWEKYELPQTAEGKLEAVRNAVRRSMYDEAVSKAREIKPVELSSQQVKQLGELLSFVEEQRLNDPGMTLNPLVEILYDLRYRISIEEAWLENANENQNLSADATTPLKASK